MLDLRDKGVGIFSRGIARIPHLSTFLGTTDLVRHPTDQQAASLSAVVGWGAKPNTDIARNFAARHRLPYISLEDGFLRSVDLGVNGAPPLAIILDAQGVYYDATGPSDLEQRLNDTGPDAPLADAELLTRATQAMQRIVTSELSKYNNSPPAPLRDLPGQRRVLVVDQTAGDMSIVRGAVPPGAFGAMLEAAQREHPDADIFIKTHPDVLSGKKRGHFSPAHHQGPRVHFLTDNANPVALLKQMHHVYVATSQMGFEALMVGVPVTCFGAPFYAGWGLTDDRVAIQRRTAQRTLAQIFAAAYLCQSRYIHPDTGALGTLEDVIEHLEAQREMFARNTGTFYCLGISLWKHRDVRAYLRAPGNDVRFCRRLPPPNALPADTRVLVWGRNPERAAVEADCRQQGIPFYHMEDGFLRSVGLGSDLTAPASLVVDSRGLYIDPAFTSDLEHILEHSAFSEAELQRAAALRTAIVDLKVSKYNVDGGDRLSQAPPQDARVLLVPGQVEDDASIQLGTVDVRTNLALLQAVRNANPDAFILFKPHPDVVSGNRRGHLPDDLARKYADAILYDASIAHCLDMAHEVHTMTSLVGFEALMRGLVVHVYGRPFYCGWGLTHDRHPVPRRTRQHTLDSLVAGTLIRYPRYLHPQTMAFTTPEFIVLKLRELTDGSPNLSTRAFRPVRQLRRLANLLQGIIHARKI
ncbi:MAG: capsular polysaccharide biosynthesis protein [Myxococcales bacterium]|nr:capsular polysaccharide biosynthesis protein [Myxococcales bacterium]